MNGEIILNDIDQIIISYIFNEMIIQDVIIEC